MILKDSSGKDPFDYKNFFVEIQQKEYDKRAIPSSIILIVITFLLLVATLIAIKSNNGYLYLLTLVTFCGFCLVFFIFIKDMLGINRNARKDYMDFSQAYQAMEEKLNLHKQNQIEITDSLSSQAIQKKIDENNRIFDENNRLSDELIPVIVTDENIIKYAKHKNLLSNAKIETPKLDLSELKKRLFDRFLLQERYEELRAKTDMQFNSFLVFLEIFWQLFTSRMGPQLMKIGRHGIAVGGVVIDPEQEVVFGPLSKLSLKGSGEKVGSYNLKTHIGHKIGISYVASTAINSPFAKSYIIISNGHGEFTILILTPGNQIKIETIITTHRPSLDKPRVFYEYEVQGAVDKLFLFKQQSNMEEISKKFPIEITNTKGLDELKLILTDLKLIHRTRAEKNEILFD